MDEQVYYLVSDWPQAEIRRREALDSSDRKGSAEEVEMVRLHDVGFDDFQARNDRVYTLERGSQAVDGVVRDIFDGSAVFTAGERWLAGSSVLLVVPWCLA